MEEGKFFICVFNLIIFWLRLLLVFLVLFTVNFGDISSDNVGVGVVERGGLVRFDIGDVVREIIFDLGIEAEKNFFDDLNIELEDLDILVFY